jgi:hypothetical protein
VSGSVLYRWLLYVHIAVVLVFVLSHGVSASVAFRLRRERNFERAGALLDLSAASYPVMFLSFLAVLATGITLGILGGWGGAAWFWASLVLWLVLVIGMVPAINAYTKVREALGLFDPHQRKRLPTPSTPPAQDEVDAFLDAAHPFVVTSIGVGGLLILLWLMMFKPF